MVIVTSTNKKRVIHCTAQKNLFFNTYWCVRTLNETAYYHVGQRCFLSGHEPLDWLAANVEQTNPSMVRFFESIDLLANTKLLGKIDEN